MTLVERYDTKVWVIEKFSAPIWPYFEMEFCILVICRHLFTFNVKSSEWLLISIQARRDYERVSRWIMVIVCTSFEDKPASILGGSIKQRF